VQAGSDDQRNRETVQFFVAMLMFVSMRAGWADRIDVTVNGPEQGKSNPNPEETAGHSVVHGDFRDEPESAHRNEHQSA